MRRRTWHDLCGWTPSKQQQRTVSFHVYRRRQPQQEEQQQEEELHADNNSNNEDSRNTMDTLSFPTWQIAMQLHRRWMRGPDHDRQTSTEDRCRDNQHPPPPLEPQHVDSRHLSLAVSRPDDFHDHPTCLLARKKGGAGALRRGKASKKQLLRWKLPHDPAGTGHRARRPDCRCHYGCFGQCYYCHRRHRRQHSVSPRQCRGRLA